jgi:LacI family transcriptional regulator
MSQSRRIPHVLLLIETSRAYGRGLVEGIAHYAEKHGPWSIQFEERGLTDPLPQWLRDWRGDGIISRSMRKRDIARLLATERPVVELYAYNETVFPNVRPDETTVARLAIEHFLDRGLRNFAFFCTNRAHWSDERCRVFEQSLRQRGVLCHSFPLMPKRRTAGNRPQSGDNRSVIRWLRSLPKPCGVLCASDSFAARLVQACRACGILVPEQIAVLGVDNDPVFCGVCLPRLSSIDLGSARIGYEAAAMLKRIMSGRTAPPYGVSILPQRVVARESTDILAIDDSDIAHAVRLIRERAHQPLRVAEVAAVVGLSRRSLEQRFRRVLRRSPKDEIVQVRMEGAKTLLATTDEAVAMIAKKSGFTSPKYFARAFRLRTGMTPLDYRNRRRPPVGNDHRQLRKR